MENQEYGIIEAEKRSSLPETKLLRVPHKTGNLVVRYPAFGPDTYKNNLAKMGERYFHSAEISDISFRSATTSESISGAAYKFGEMAKPQILSPNWLQAGPIVITSKGVFANTKETEEAVLKSLLDKCEKVNGIYLYNGEDPRLRDFGLAPYETFKLGIQDSGDFAESGLARLLEHTHKKSAPNLREISSAENYLNGVDVFGFDSVKEPVLRVAYLSSSWFRLHVDGDYLDFRDGYAFGVRSTDAEGVVAKI